MIKFGITYADFFSNNVNNRGDYLYGTVHIVWLAFTVLLCVLMSVFLRKNRHAGKIIAGFCLSLMVEQLFARGAISILLCEKYGGCLAQKQF